MPSLLLAFLEPVMLFVPMLPYFTSTSWEWLVCYIPHWLIFKFFTFG
jgi:hypothetical protein